MKISKTFFWAIFFLALLLPFSSNWKLLLFGEKRYGVVTGYKGINGSDISSYHSGDTYSVISFTTEYENVILLGPDNLILPLGKKIKICYDQQEPTHCIPLHFATLYLGKQMIIPVIFLFLWIALYTSLKQTEYQQKKRTAFKLGRSNI